MFKNISVGILSFRAPKTIGSTLNNYKKNDFFKLFSSISIFFQGSSEKFLEEDKKIADKYKEYSVNSKFREENLGIQEGMYWVINNLNTEYVLYLENDQPLITNIENCEIILEKSLQYLESNKLDLVRLRSRFNAGEQFCDVNKYTSLYDTNCIDERFNEFEKISKRNKLFKKINRFFRPNKKIKMIGRSVYIEKYPEKLFPKYIKKLDDNFYSVDSQCIAWTNQPFLIKKDLFLKIITWCKNNPSKPINGFQAMEPNLNRKNWWAKQHFKVGVHNGIFTHKRLDR